jgi:hypothetical protein
MRNSHKTACSFARLSGMETRAAPRRALDGLGFHLTSKRRTSDPAKLVTQTETPTRVIANAPRPAGKESTTAFVAGSDAVPLDLPVERPAAGAKRLLPALSQLRPIGVADRDAAEGEQPAQIDLAALVQEQQIHGRSGH